MSAFLPDPAPPAPPAESPHWRTLLLASAALAAVATTRPWVRVQFDRLFGSYQGPPGWQSQAGFTCLCTCLLVATMALAETQARVTWQAVRPASLLLVAICTLAISLEWWDGPGQLRGVTACWTLAFWVLLASLPALLLACTRRCAALRPRARGRGM